SAAACAKSEAYGCSKVNDTCLLASQPKNHSANNQPARTSNRTRKKETAIITLTTYRWNISFCAFLIQKTGPPACRGCTWGKFFRSEDQRAIVGRDARMRCENSGSCAPPAAFASSLISERRRSSSNG